MRRQSSHQTGYLCACVRLTGATGWLVNVVVIAIHLGCINLNECNEQLNQTHAIDDDIINGKVTQTQREYLLKEVKMMISLRYFNQEWKTNKEHVSKFEMFRNFAFFVLRNLLMLQTGNGWIFNSFIGNPQK